MELYSLQIERHVLGGLLKNPKLLYEIDRFISDSDFYQPTHGTIFSVIKSLILSGGNIDKIVVSEKIKNLGISFKDEINIYDYIENLSFTQISKKGLIDSSKELLKLRIRRDLIQNADKIKEYVKGSGTDSIEEIVSSVDRLHSEKIDSYCFSDEPVNLFQGVEELVEETGNNPEEESGLRTPYPEFNRLFGGLKPANIYAIVSRPAQGKTTWINDMAFKTSIINNVKVLVLDTEMSTKEMQFRMTASVSGVPVWYLETGKWRNNQEMVDKVRAAFKKVKEYRHFHYHVGNKTIDEICSMIRRWYYSEVGRGERCLIAYDYVKLTGEKVGYNWAEHQAIGDKIDKLKKISEEINCPIITAMQMNRQGESFNRKGSDLVDDASAISLSDRLQWFASFVAIFRRKTIDEIALDGEQFGSHKLIPLKTRFQGKDAAGHHDLIKRTLDDGTERYANNYLNFDVDNFNIEEKGSLQRVVEAAREDHVLDDVSEADGELL
jgi:replicative DNA helicase